MAGFIQNTLNLRIRAENSALNIDDLMTKAERVVASVISGEHAQRKAGGHEKFWQYRDYMQGDRPQDIDWRQSAKTQRVYIRQKEWHNTQDTIFWCSAYDGMNFHSGDQLSKAEIAKTLTLALSILLTRSGERAALMNATRVGRSEKALEDIANTLCAGNDATALPSIKKHIPQNTSIILSGDFLSDINDIKHSLERIAARSENGLLVQILDPAEIDLPYNGRVVFENMNSTARENIHHAGSIRTQYQARIQDHITALERLCKDFGWHYVLHRTDAALSDTLRVIWTEMSR